MYHGATREAFTAPPWWQMAAVFLGTVIAVAALAALPVRLGARRPIAGILAAETA